MPQIGDLLARLGQREPLTPGEIDELRLEMNKLQYSAGAVSTVVSPTGGLAADVFQKGTYFPLLPHQAGFMYKTANQSIAGAGFENITWDETSTAQKLYDMRQDPATSPTTFIIPGAAGAVFLTIVRVKWAGNATGVRSMLLVTNEANRYQATNSPPDANEYQQEWVLPYFSVTQETKFSIAAAQTSGGALNILANNCYFGILRIR